MQYILDNISKIKIIETTLSILVGLLFAFIVWLIRLAYEKRTKEIHLIAEIERISVYNNAVITNYIELIKQWLGAIEAHEPYTTRFSLYNLGKDLKTTALDLKLTNLFSKSTFSLESLESDISNIYETYSETTKILINRDVQTQEQRENWYKYNDILLPTLSQLLEKLPEIQEDILKVVSYSRLLFKQKKISIFTLIDFLNINIFPRINDEDILNIIKEIKKEGDVK